MQIRICGNNQEPHSVRIVGDEEAAFYAYCADRDNPELKAAHEKAKAELVAYFERTRCHNP